MAFASPDPKRVEADKARIRQRHLDDVATFEKDRRIKREMQECYEEYTPTQIAQGHTMIACNSAVERHTLALALGKAEGAVCWERIGVSRGGKQRKNLYRCVVQ